MLLDDGILELYTLQNVAENGRMPVYKLVLSDKAYYGERTVGYNRLYAAKGVNQQIDKLIRIWRNDTVEVNFYVILEDKKQYRVDAVQHLYDDDGLKVTDLTLSKLEKFYDVAENEDGDTSG